MSFDEKVKFIEEQTGLDKDLFVEKFKGTNDDITSAYWADDSSQGSNECHRAREWFKDYMSKLGASEESINTVLKQSWMHI